MTAEQTNLLVCRDKGLIIPVCKQTFKVTQSPLDAVNRNYNGCWVIHRDGSTKEFLSAKKTALWGHGIFRKVVSALTGAYSIETEFKSLGTLSVEELKTIISELLTLDSASEDPSLPQTMPVSTVLASVESAQSTKAVFDCINMPAVEDCLDVL